MQINFPICKFLSVPEFCNATGEKMLGAKPDFVCVCVCVCVCRLYIFLNVAHKVKPKWQIDFTHKILEPGRCSQIGT